MEILKSEEEKFTVLLQQKDTKAFEAFYDKYAPAVYALLILHFKNKDKCLPLLQHIFIRFYKELNTAPAFTNSLFICLYRIALKIIAENKGIL